MNKSFSTVSMLAAFIGLAFAGTANAAKLDKVNGCDRFAHVSPLNWADADPSMVRTAVQTLISARDHGLDPKDYQARTLVNEGYALTSGTAQSPDTKRIARFNRAMTRNVSCYLQNVKGGRLNPHAIYKQIWLPRQKFNAGQQLTEAFQNNTVEQLLQGAAPQTDSYSNLRQALAQLRSSSLLESAVPTLPTRLAEKLTMGQRNKIVPVLRSRLSFLGDLTPNHNDEFAGMDKNLFSKDIFDALVAFQKRHGLEADGVLGSKTLNVMRTSMPTRIAQIELAMERERWYPRHTGKRVVRVNIPQFKMQASAPDANGDVVTMDGKVIVGRPGRSYTPLFAGPISRIEFSPKWFVPQGFAKRKLLPRLRRDPGYLKRKDMEIRLPGGKLTQRATRHNLSLIAQGRASLRQRSGPKNALGQVKFILPNSRAIFMHDTNRRDLFSKNSRALSLGCVRLEKPLELARLILADNADWSAEKIAKAAKSNRTQVANSTGKTIVMLGYQTAVATNDGQLSFFNDLYKMDAKAMKYVSRWAKPRVIEPGIDQLANANSQVNG